jgi:hypothetical protein
LIRDKYSDSALSANPKECDAILQLVNACKHPKSIYCLENAILSTIWINMANISVIYGVLGYLFKEVCRLDIISTFPASKWLKK